MKKTRYKKKSTRIPSSRRRSRQHNARDVFIFIGLFILFVTIWYIVTASRTQQKLQTKAGTNTIRISVQPSAQTMPPNAIFQLWATADNPVAFITTKLIFDPTVVQMNGELSLVSPLARVVKKTSMAEANQTGVVSFSVGLDPSMRANVPIGTFQLATFPLTVKSPIVKKSAVLHLDAPSMQAVNPNLSEFTITTTDSSITINSTVTSPNGTPTITITSSPIPTIGGPSPSINPSVSINPSASINPSSTINSSFPGSTSKTFSTSGDEPSLNSLIQPPASTVRTGNVFLDLWQLFYGVLLRLIQMIRK